MANRTKSFRRKTDIGKSIEGYMHRLTTEVSIWDNGTNPCSYVIMDCDGKLYQMFLTDRLKEQLLRIVRLHGVVKIRIRITFLGFEKVSTEGMNEKIKKEKGISGNWYTRSYIYKKKYDVQVLEVDGISVDAPKIPETKARVQKKGKGGFKEWIKKLLALI